MKNFDLKQSWRKIIASVLVISLCLIAFFPLTKAQSADLPLSRKLKITEASSEAADLAIQLAANSVYTLEVLSSNLNGAWRIRNSGTAILLDESGYFLTLASSIAQACDREGKIKPRTVIRVSNALPKAEFECELLARDYETDLAILKLKPGQKASSLPTLDLENSRAVSLGEKLVHLGANDPFKNIDSISFGHVVALKAPLVSESGLAYLLFESEAMIAKNDLFGPAFGLDGKLLGFSIYKKDRISSDRNSYFYSTQSLTAALQRLLKKAFKDLREGAEVPQQLENLMNLELSGGCADLDFGGASESSNSELPPEEERVESESTEPEEEAEAEQAELEKPDDRGANQESSEENTQEETSTTPEAEYEIFLGLSFYCDDYYAELRKRYKLPEGLMLAEINSQGPAYTAGLNEREIIIEANGEKIESFDDFYKITVELKSGDLLNLKLSCEDGSVKAYKIYVKKMPLN